MGQYRYCYTFCILTFTLEFGQAPTVSLSVIDLNNHVSVKCQGRP